MGNRPRFVWMPAGQSLQEDHHSHIVVDTEPPGGKPGEATVFAACPNKQAAVMTCMSLNGQAEPAEREETS